MKRQPLEKEGLCPMTLNHSVADSSLENKTCQGAGNTGSPSQDSNQKNTITWNWYPEKLKSKISCIIWYGLMNSVGKSPFQMLSAQESNGVLLPHVVFINPNVFCMSVECMTVTCLFIIKTFKRVRQEEPGNKDKSQMRETIVHMIRKNYSPGNKARGMSEPWMHDVLETVCLILLS